MSEHASGDFQQRYRAVIEALHGPLPSQAGISRFEIESAEKASGIRLPTALRDFYLVAGNFLPVIRVHNRFYAPANFVRGAGKVVFLEENQQVVYWALETEKLSLSDPPVLQGVNRQVIEWYAESDRCSDFLVGMTYWQALNGGLKYFGWADAHADTEDRLRSNLPLVWRDNGLEVFNQGGVVISWRPRQASEVSGLAAIRPEIEAVGRAPVDLDQLRRSLGIAWTFSNLPPEMQPGVAPPVAARIADVDDQPISSQAQEEAVVQLRLASGETIARPSDKDISEALASQRFAVLSVGPDSYMQFVISRRRGRQLEYQVDVLENHFSATDGPLPMERIVSAFQKFARGDDSWKQDFTWARWQVKEVAGRRTLLPPQ